MGDFTDILYYILVPTILAILPIIYAIFNKDKVTSAAVNQYILEELKNDIKELKDKVRILELLSPGSLK